MIAAEKKEKKSKKTAPARASYFSADEKGFIEGFLERGYAIVPLEHKERLDAVRQAIYDLGCAHLGLNGKKKPPLAEFFDHTERFVNVETLNGLRLAVINGLNKVPGLMAGFFSMARRHIEWAVGNEIAMQRGVSLSVQLPNDDSSLLPLHSDVWDGNSPYEIVLWLPLVDCYKTKSMYVLPRGKSRQANKSLMAKGFNAEEVFARIKPDLVWLDVPYGNAVLFTHCLMHGNRVNEETTTRWTFNIRLKGLLTPYGAKELGESFVPVTTRPATRIGFEWTQDEKHP